METIRKLVRYKAWADELLFAEVARMPAEALVAPQPIVFGNLLRTLNHVLAMDFVWQSHLLGRPHGLTTRNPADCPPLDEIARRQAAIDRWYVDYTQTLDAAAFDEAVAFVFIGGGPGRMTRADILVHVVNHGTYHRGHVAQIMRPLQPPPVSDYPVFLKETSGD
jgi:uncharacterized damage-inducible protein DinB